MKPRAVIAGMLAALLLVGPAHAAPKVITLGGDQTQDSDPVAACGALAASPFEAGRAATGLLDDQVFLDGALPACQAAVQAAPDSVEAMTWLARVLLLVGRPDEARPLLEMASQSGGAFAAYLLGRLLAPNTSSDTEDYYRGVDLLKQASGSGFAPAQTVLAGIFETVDRNFEDAYRLYESASKLGDGFASFKAGALTEAGSGTDQDFAKAMAFYQKATEQGAAEGWGGIGALYQNGLGVDTDNARAAEAYQRGADANEKVSLTALAYLYEQGLGVTQDYDKSFALLTKAAAQNHGFAQAALALHYLYGEGTPVDTVKAYNLAWAAQQNHVTYAEGILGYLYSEGLGTERSLADAASHFEEGANAGDQYSADRLVVIKTELACQDVAGSPYEPGAFSHGVAFEALDSSAAIAACEAAVQANDAAVGDKVWLARAYLKDGRVRDALPLLEQGVAANNVLAQYLYAGLLATGDGLEQDQARAIELYRTSAEAGFAESQYELGLIYRNGRSVPVDKVAALEWYRKALFSGYEAAQADIDALSSSGGFGLDLTGFVREGPAY